MGGGGGNIYFEKILKKFLAINNFFVNETKSGQPKNAFSH